MTKEEIIELAKEADIDYRADIEVFCSKYFEGIVDDNFEYFARLIVRKERERRTVVATDAAMKLEREACANIVENAAWDIVDQIRARNKLKEKNSD